MKYLPILLAAVALPMGAPAQTVTVNQTATPGATTFNTIGDALAAVAADPASPDVITVTDSAKYEEALTITVPVVLEAASTERPTILVLGNSAGTRENGGIVVDLPGDVTTGTVVLRNLVIIPSLLSDSLRLQSAIENHNNNLYLWIDKCLITANDGHDLPIVTDGLTSRIYDVYPGTTTNPNPTYDPSIVQFGDDGIVLGRTDNGAIEGAGVELLFKDSIISHFRNDYHEPDPKPSPYAIEMASSYVYDQAPPYPTEFRLTRIEGASAISFAKIGIHATGDIEMKSDSERIRMRGFSGEAIHFVGPAPNYRNISDTIIDGSSANGIWDQGFGSVRMTMKNCIVYYCGRHVIMVRKTTNGVGEGLMTIEDSTLVGGRDINAGVHTFRFEPGTTLDVLLRNSIIGGKKDLPAAAANVISLAGDNTVTLEGTAIVTEGPFALRNTSSPFSLSATSTVIGTPINGDPLFMDCTPNESDPHKPNWLPPSADYMNVQNNAYATANADGGPLGGGAEFVGGSSNVPDWTLY